MFRKTQIEYYLVKLQSFFIHCKIVPPINDDIDGCSCPISKLYQWITKTPISFEYCCNEHDMFYIEGGLESDRRIGDKRLRNCIRKTNWNLLNWLFFLFVRCFGWLYFNYQNNISEADK